MDYTPGDTSVSTKEARIHLTEILGRTEYGKERIRLTRRGKTVAYIVPEEDAAFIQKLEDAEDARQIKLSMKEMAEGKYSSWEDVKKRLDARKGSTTKKRKK